MKNKKAQFFAMYFVVLTLFMCGFVIFVYYLQEKQVSSALVSPVYLLQLEDKKELFEMQEKKLLLEFLEKLDWNSQTFENDAKEGLCNLFMQNEQKNLRDFIFENISDENWRDISGFFELDRSKKNFCENIYEPKLLDNKKQVSIKRGIARKILLLRADYPQKDKIKFNVKVRYEFEEEYLVTKEDDKIIIREG